VKKKLVLALALAAVAGCARQLPPPETPLPEPAPAPSEPAPVPPEDRPAAEQPSPTEVAPEPDPSLPEPSYTDEVRLKVGLATDLGSVTFPCCEEPLAVEAEGRPLAVSSSLRLEPAAASAEKGFYRLQAAALRDERQAQELARRLEAALGQPAYSVFDAGTDLYRVRVGRYESREEAGRDLRRLGGLGIAGAFVVSDGAGVRQPALRLIQGGSATVVPGRWVSVAPVGTESVRVEGKRYRGRVLVYLNDRGLLNLINEVDLEDYLRGVVPSEMGPILYNQLEALKAQAVAARTYTLRNLGEFLSEGYDICATPRCQVYKGVAVEHRLSDRAIAETAGQVLLYRGGLADTLYSSTCGGHTEDAHVIFPLKREPYLAGVPCMEVGVARIAGDGPHGLDLAGGLMRRVLPAAPGAPPHQGLAARLEHLALLAGLPAPAGRLASLDRREVQRYVGHAFDLVLDARLLLAPEDVAYLLDDPPAGWSEEELRQAAYFVRSGLSSGPLDRPLDEAEVERMLLALAELVRVVRREELSYLSFGDGRLAVKDSNGEPRTVEVPGRLATFRRYGERMTGADLSLVPGDRVTLFWQGDRLVALAQEVDLDGVSFDRSSAYSHWTRFRSDSQLAALVNTRFPGLGFRGLALLDRGGSGRVGRIRVDGSNGQSVEVEGLAVRWTLDVPDTLFTAKRLAPKGQEPGWLFTGRGFGHGVGLCQVGAYGMAQRGRSYREILSHYYTGVELSRVRSVVPAAAAPAAAGGR
jgi:stage II sporulation protein D